MKSVLRYFLINTISLWAVTAILPGLSFGGEIKTLFLGGGAFTIINFILVPLLRILLLPLNILTLGLFSWVTNVLALYALINFIPGFLLTIYSFPGFEYNGFIIPSMDFSTMMAAIIASFLIGFFTHFLHWLCH